VPPGADRAGEVGVGRAQRGKEVEAPPGALVEGVDERGVVLARVAAADEGVTLSVEARDVARVGGVIAELLRQGLRGVDQQRVGEYLAGEGACGGRHGGPECERGTDGAERPRGPGTAGSRTSPSAILPVSHRFPRCQSPRRALQRAARRKR